MTTEEQAPVDQDFAEACAKIHEQLAGSPLAERFLLIEQSARAWRMWIDCDLSDYEAEAISGAEERSGVIWRCLAPFDDVLNDPDDACGARNFYADASCCDCGTPRPEKEAGR